jgi:hypothetical protein
MTIDRRGFLGLAAAIVLVPAAVLGLKRRPNGILIEADTSKFGALGQEVSLKLEHFGGPGRTITIEIPRARIVESGFLVPEGTVAMDTSNRIDPWPGEEEMFVAFS